MSLLRTTRSRVRTALAAAAVGLLGVTSVAAPAGAQVTRDADNAKVSHAANAAATAIDITVFGERVAAGGILASSLETTPRAVTKAIGFLGTNASITEADVGTTDSVRSPTEGQACGVPGLPEPLDAVQSVIPLGISCSLSAASLDGLKQNAHGEATVADLSLNVDELADAIVALIVAPLSDALGGALGPLELGVESDLTDQLLATCNTTDPAVADVVAGVQSGLGDGLPVGDLLQAIADASGDLGATCTDALEALVTALTSVTAGDLTAIIDLLRDLILDRLGEEDLLTLVLGEAVNELNSEDGFVASQSAIQPVRIATPSLAFVLGLITGLIDDTVGDYLASLDDVIGALPVDLPAPSELITTLLDALPDIFSDDPILEVSVQPTIVAASLDRGTGDVTRRAEGGAVVVDIASGLATLLGVDEVTEIPAGDELILFADTPLESRIARGTIVETETTNDGITSQGVESEGVSIELLTELNGGIDVAVAAASASVGGSLTLPQTTPGDTTLPRTGDDKTPILSALLVVLAAVVLAASRVSARKPELS